MHQMHPWVPQNRTRIRHQEPNLHPYRLEAVTFVATFNSASIKEMEHSTNGQGVSATVRRDPATGAVRVEGRLTVLGAPQPQTIEWIAAAPVTCGISFSGSGQPYPNKHIAFEGTPNKGQQKSQDGSFSFTLPGIPAGYYSGLGAMYIPPTIEFYTTSAVDPTLKAKALLAITETAAPFRWLGGAPPTLVVQENTPTSTGRAMYYAGRETIPVFSNQEALLRAKAYPGDMTARGWPEADDMQPWSNIPAPA